VLASTDYALFGSVFGIENLTLIGAAVRGFGDDGNNVVTGSVLDNELYGLQGSDTIAGNDGNDTLVGGAGDDSLLGGAGNDALFGELLNEVSSDTLDGGAGDDTLDGGAGNDTYIADSAGDFVTERSNGGGIDTVLASTDYALFGSVFGIENLTLIGAAVRGFGDDGNNVVTGSALDNELYGLQGSDTIAGNDGNDTLVGGAGDDSLLGGASNDALFGEFFDEVSNDTLDGGAGDDTLDGGAGNDVYIADSASDFAGERFNGDGIDTVLASTDYALFGSVFGIENLTLTGAAVQGFGDDGNNVVAGNGLGNLLFGNEGNDTLQGNGGGDSLYGGAGDDTYLVTGGEDLFEVEGEGTDTVRALVDYKLAEGAANIENLVLAGSAIVGEGNDFANAIFGNDLSNALYGFAGDDTLDGGLGSDLLAGGAGDDIYVLSAADDDNIAEDADNGTDTVRLLEGFYFLSANVENLLVEGLALGGVGNGLANLLLGSENDNVLAGAGGNDTLDGGGGADEMAGGAGDDTYIVDSRWDRTFEVEGEGTDTIVSSVDVYLLDAGIENLTLRDLAFDGYGNELNNKIAASENGSRLFGLDGNDTLIGVVYDTLDGGAGADLMIGGVAGAVFYVDNAGDAVVADSDGGWETVYSTIDYKLTAEIEELYLLDSASQGVGNDLNNLIVASNLACALSGLAGNDTLVSGSGDDTLIGGAGIDSMAGGAGDDAYEVDDPLDEVVEAADEGTDTVRSSVSLALGANLENLTLLGTADIDGTGNALSNLLVGNGGDNRLDGGLGADTLIGGAGDDDYVVETPLDVVVEFAGEGDDSVFSLNSYVLGDNLENLTLTGNGNVAATGNALNNRLTGNIGNNLLDGGAGADSLAGGLGDDTYVIDSKLDVLTEVAGGGFDTVVSSVSYTLGEQFEALVLNGGIVGRGNAADNLIQGDGNDNRLFGGAGNDTVDGGAGIDVMAGGIGDDTYFVDHRFDAVLEADGEGNDTVISSVTRIIGSNIENLTLLGSEAINGTGNGLANMILGNDGANRLRGSAGNDTLAGGGGIDTLSGGSGQDRFLAGDPAGGGAADGPDIVTDFDIGPASDVLDIADLLNGYIPGSSAIGDFVRTLQIGGDTVVEVDRDGADGGAGFAGVFTLAGVTTTVDELLAGGNLQLA
jgi:Ca2+-binding RTX toxin-like protein